MSKPLKSQFIKRYIAFNIYNAIASLAKIIPDMVVCCIYPMGLSTICFFFTIYEAIDVRYSFQLATTKIFYAHWPCSWCTVWQGGVGGILSHARAKYNEFNVMYGKSLVFGLILISSWSLIGVEIYKPYFPLQLYFCNFFS